LLSLYFHYCCEKMNKILISLLALAVAAQGMPSVTVVEIERRDNMDERGELLEGDIMLAPGQKAGIIGATYRWPNAEVPYTIDGAFTAAERTIINQGLADITSNTCIRLVQRTNQANYVAITRGAANSGCWSYVGRIGGAQTLNLQPGSPGCVFKGIVTHEMVHAIGFYHEQSRTDRDDYVTINWGNIQAGTENNFNKYTASQVDPQGVTYDYGSIMHYSAYSFAVNPNIQTIIPKEAGAAIGQRNQLSPKDIQKLRKMYNC